MAAHAHEGAAGVIEALEEICGVSRSTKSVINHASRMGVSLRTKVICPMCGMATVSIDPKTGFCKACTARIRIDQTRRRTDEARRELQDEQRRLNDANAAYSAAKQAGYRSRKVGNK
jgi:hypothetical protein